MSHTPSITTYRVLQIPRLSPKPRHNPHAALTVFSTAHLPASDPAHCNGPASATRFVLRYPHRSSTMITTCKHCCRVHELTAASAQTVTQSNLSLAWCYMGTPMIRLLSIENTDTDTFITGCQRASWLIPMGCQRTLPDLCLIVRPEPEI